ncbi:uncharacterized protein [Amphiura filiformis]|uniref:uncharacterized protein n=1 Tax=Amphiura filiformis TaxID=82378 RepID=UPI003B213AC0
MASDLPPLPKTFVGSAILQLVAGAVALNAGSLALIWGCTNGYIATGIWVGSVVFITSIIGILTAVYRERSWVISYLSLSLLGALLGLTLVAIELSALWTDLQCRDYPITCDTQCIRVHEFNIGSGAVEIFGAFGAVVLCLKNLWELAQGVPYSKLVKHTNI